MDSGNLAGHLIALKQACLDKQSGPISFEWARDGLQDTLDLLAESAGTLSTRRQDRVVGSRQLGEELREAGALLSNIPDEPEPWAERLAALEVRAETLVDIVRAFGHEDAAADGAALEWALALKASVESHRRDLDAPETGSRSGGDRGGGRPSRGGDGLHVPL